jgi:hypothetical protein
MENLTDLLTNIFVSHKPKNKQPEATPKAIPEESTSDSGKQDSTSSSSSSTSSSDKISKRSSHNSHSSKDSESSNSEDDDESESESESSDDTTSESSSSTISSEAVKKTEVPEVSKSVKKTEVPEVSKSVKKTEVPEVSKSVKKTEVSKSVKKTEVSKVSKSVKKTEVPEVYKSVKKTEVPEVYKQSIKKLVLKASEFYKKNMLILNNDNSKNIDILNDLLFKLSKLNDVENIYDNSLHIFTFNENKKDFRDMLLENPYLYFNNLIIKNTLTLPQLESGKRHLFIIDYSIKSDIEKLHKLINKDNVHVIIYNNNYSSDMVDVYKLLGDNALIINSKDRLKILQKRFYSKIVKYLVDDATTDNFFDVINDDNLDVKYLMIKNNELRYS